MIKAFVGHSFSNTDREIVRSFLDFFDTVVHMGIGFSWEHAESAEPKELSVKVKEKMEGKNLFIGICTARERVIDKEKLTAFPVFKTKLWSSENNFETKTSDWLLQEIGFAFGRDMKLLILLESGLKMPGGIQGDIEYIQFTRTNPEKSFSKVIEMLNALRASAIPQEQKESPVEASKPEQINENVETPKAQPGEDIPPSDWTKTQYEFELSSAIIEGDESREQIIHENFSKSEFGSDPNDLIVWNSYSLYLKILLRNESRLNELLYLQQQNPDNPIILAHIAGSYAHYDEYERAATYFEKSAMLSKDTEAKFRRLNNASLNYAKSKQREKAIWTNRLSLSVLDKSENSLTAVFAAQADFLTR